MNRAGFFAATMARTKAIGDAVVPLRDGDPGRLLAQGFAACVEAVGRRWIPWSGRSRR